MTWKEIETQRIAGIIPCKKEGRILTYDNTHPIPMSPRHGIRPVEVNSSWQNGCFNFKFAWINKTGQLEICHQLNGVIAAREIVTADNQHKELVSKLNRWQVNLL